ncbi:hypothetical protein PHISCL_01835 [Aspergillus sclerotialis]|uniref:Uncharacterized protein n=1 Tax=Aspergillus sclerotialis TaxID=2070753 RepID=A0A3A2ZRS0_9EURO|nr:hypothetical protein PHISCL_01835 [Aspergillus sclerotialis]
MQNASESIVIIPLNPSPNIATSSGAFASVVAPEALAIAAVGSAEDAGLEAAFAAASGWVSDWESDAVGYAVAAVEDAASAVPLVDVVNAYAGMVFEDAEFDGAVEVDASAVVVVVAVYEVTASVECVAAGLDAGPEEVACAVAPVMTAFEAVVCEGVVYVVTPSVAVETGVAVFGATGLSVVASEEIACVVSEFGVSVASAGNGSAFGDDAAVPVEIGFDVQPDAAVHVVIEPAAVVSEAAFAAPGDVPVAAPAATGHAVVAEFEIASPSSVAIPLVGRVGTVTVQFPPVPPVRHALSAGSPQIPAVGLEARDVSVASPEDDQSSMVLVDRPVSLASASGYLRLRTCAVVHGVAFEEPLNRALLLGLTVLMFHLASDWGYLQRQIFAVFHVDGALWFLVSQWLARAHWFELTARVMAGVTLAAWCPSSPYHLVSPVCPRRVRELTAAEVAGFEVLAGVAAEFAVDVGVGVEVEVESEEEAIHAADIEVAGTVVEHGTDSAEASRVGWPASERNSPNQTENCHVEPAASAT